MEVLGRLLGMFIVSAVVAAGGTVAEWILSKKVRCPKCHRVMQRRPAWYVCGHCDSYVIFDFVSFCKHWHLEGLRDECNT